MHLTWGFACSASKLKTTRTQEVQTASKLMRKKSAKPSRVGFEVTSLHGFLHSLIQAIGGKCQKTMDQNFGMSKLKTSPEVNKSLKE